MTDVLTTCAVVIFSVKMSCITSVDGIKLKIEDKADRTAKVYKLICPIFRPDKTSLHQGLEKLSDGIREQNAKASYLIEKTLSLQMNREASRIYGYTFVCKANSVLSAKVNIITSCSCGCKSLEYFIMPLSFMRSKNAPRSYLKIFKCALPIWISSFTVARDPRCALFR